MSSRPRVASLLLPFLALSAQACSSPGLDEQLDSVHSWTATAQLTNDRRTAHAISERYAEQLDKEARSALEELKASIGKSITSSQDRARATASLDSLQDALHQLEAASRP